jgi:hypothetical protein
MSILASAPQNGLPLRRRDRLLRLLAAGAHALPTQGEGGRGGGRGRGGPGKSDLGTGTKEPQN